MNAGEAWLWEQRTSARQSGRTRLLLEGVHAYKRQFPDKLVVVACVNAQHARAMRDEYVRLFGSVDDDLRFEPVESRAMRMMPMGTLMMNDNFTNETMVQGLVDEIANLRRRIESVKELAAKL